MPAKGRLSKAASALAREAARTESPERSYSSGSDYRPRQWHRVDETQTQPLALLPGAEGAATYAEAASKEHMHGDISAPADTSDALRALRAEVGDLKLQVGRLEVELVSARAQPQIAPALAGAPQNRRRGTTECAAR